MLHNLSLICGNSCAAHNTVFWMVIVVQLNWGVQFRESDKCFKILPTILLSGIVPPFIFRLEKPTFAYYQVVLEYHPNKTLREIILYMNTMPKCFTVNVRKVCKFLSNFLQKNKWQILTEWSGNVQNSRPWCVYCPRPWHQYYLPLIYLTGLKLVKNKRKNKTKWHYAHTLRAIYNLLPCRAIYSFIAWLCDLFKPSDGSKISQRGGVPTP